MIKLIIGVIAAVFVVIVGFLVIDPNVNNGTNYDTTIVSEQSTFTITIEGQVTKPGTYSQKIFHSRTSTGMHLRTNQKAHKTKNYSKSMTRPSTLSKIKR